MRADRGLACTAFSFALLGACASGGVRPDGNGSFDAGASGDGAVAPLIDGAPAVTIDGATIDAGGLPSGVDSGAPTDGSVAPTPDAGTPDAGAPPPTCTGATTDADFEIGLPSGYVTSGDATWSRTGSVAHGGSGSIVSGDIDAYGQVRLQVTVDVVTPTTVSFWYRVSSETVQPTDYLAFFVDSGQLGRWGGDLASWTLASFPLAVGTHTLEWRYRKDSSASEGSDCAWLDDVRFDPPICR